MDDSTNQSTLPSVPDTAAQSNESESADTGLSAAQRALQEAELRRSKAAEAHQKPEVAGRGGLEPTRYGDWEVKGLTSDF